MVRYTLLSVLMVFTAGCNVADAEDKPLLALELEEIFAKGPVRELADAAGKGRIKKIDELIAKGVDVNSVGTAGLPVLYWALHELNYKGFVALLERGANPNHLWETGDSVTSFTAAINRSEFLQAVLQHGGDPNLKRPKTLETPLFEAVSEDGAGNIDILVKAGADVNAQDGTGDTPAQKASALNRYDVVLKLLKYGADCTIPDRWNYTLVDDIENVVYGVDRESESFKQRLEVVEYLRGKGVEVNLRFRKMGEQREVKQVSKDKGA